MKSANIFLTEDGTVKLGDFNMSKVINKNKMMETRTGTPYYISPEIWNDEKYDIKTDIWSLGCLIYEIVTLEHAFKANDMKEMKKKIVVSDYHVPKKNEEYPIELYDMIESILMVIPDLRPSCADLLNKI